jgi:hypothetical protein
MRKSMPPSAKMSVRSSANNLSKSR